MGYCVFMRLERVGLREGGLWGTGVFQRGLCAGWWQWAVYSVYPAKRRWWWPRAGDLSAPPTLVGSRCARERRSKTSALRSAWSGGSLCAWAPGRRRVQQHDNPQSVSSLGVAMHVGLFPTPSPRGPALPPSHTRSCGLFFKRKVSLPNPRIHTKGQIFHISTQKKSKWSKIPSSSGLLSEARVYRVKSLGCHKTRCPKAEAGLVCRLRDAPPSSSASPPTLRADRPTIRTGPPPGCGWCGFCWVCAAKSDGKNGTGHLWDRSVGPPAASVPTASGRCRRPRSSRPRWFAANRGRSPPSR